MKRLIQIILCITFLIPTAAIVSADDKVQGGMTIHTTKIVKEKKEKKTIDQITPGYQNIITLKYMYDIFSERKTEDFPGAFCLDYIYGYRFNNTFFLGAGIGIKYEVDLRPYGDFYSESDYMNEDFCLGREVTIPIFLHARAYLSKKRFQPFFAISAGAYIALKNCDVRFYAPNYEYGAFKGYTCIYEDDYNTSSLFIEPAFGVDYRLSSKHSISMMVGVDIHSEPRFKLESGAVKHFLGGSSALFAKIGYSF